MERKDAIVTGAVAGLAVIAAGAAVAVNLGVFGPRADAAGSLGAQGEEVAVTLDAPPSSASTDGPVPDIETVYVDVYDDATGASAPGTRAASTSSSRPTPSVPATADDDGSEGDGDPDDRAGDDREEDDHDEDADHHEEEREYEGRDDDD